MPLLPWMKKQGEDGKESVEIKLDEETQKKLDKSLSLGDDLAKMREQLEGLKGIQAFVDDQRKEKEEAASRARAAAQAVGRCRRAQPKTSHPSEMEESTI